ncbi:MAG TPA: GyrI-like domain-containing protein [Anaerolineae bacterium]|nr:GyrI-like domain-containing protein [Anaerolineae bacterium]
MTYQCEIKDQTAQPTLAVRMTVAVQDLPAALGASYGAIGQCLAMALEAPAGAPFVAYYSMDMQALDVEIGIPVARPLPGKDNVYAGEIPAGKYAACRHTGPYDTIEPAYTALTQFVIENGYEATGVAYEVYLNDPSHTPPEALMTQILFPLKAA